MYYNQERIASKEGREAIEVFISEDRFRMLFEGKDFVKEEMEEVKKQLEAMRRRLYTLERLEFEGFGTYN